MTNEKKSFGAHNQPRAVQNSIIERKTRKIRKSALFRDILKQPLEKFPALLQRLRVMYPESDFSEGSETLEDVLILNQVRIGLMGKDADATSAAKFLFERAYGKPVESIEIDTPDPIRRIEILGVPNGELGFLKRRLLPGENETEEEEE